MRALSYGLLALLAGCASLPAWGRPVAAPRGRLLASVRVTGRVDALVTNGPAVQGFCAVSWRLSGDTLDIFSVESAAPETATCQGNPVFLSRPVCALTVRETLYYPQSTPIVAIRCPYGASGYITGFSKATRGGV